MAIDPHEPDDEPIDPLEEEEQQLDWRSKFTDLGAAERKEVVWVIENILPIGLTIIGAPPKENKSTVAVALALMAAGIKVKALPPEMSTAAKTGKVLLFSFEADDGELRQMAEDGLHVTVPADGRCLVSSDPWQWQLDDPEKMSDLLAVLKDQGPVVVVLDTFRDLHTFEEKDSGMMIRLLTPLREWAIEHESSIILVHHTAKVDDDVTTLSPKHLRGSGAIFGKADAVIMLNKRLDGKHHIGFTGKRAKSWETTVQLAIYDVTGDGSEVMGEREELVLAGLRAKATLEQIARQLRIGKPAVVACCQKLVRNGYLVKGSNGRFKVQKKEMVR